MNQQLETRKKIVEAEEQQYKRMGKGRTMAQSRRIYRVLQTEDDIFYVESESTDNVYYYVKFKPDVEEYCTCSDNSLRRGGQMKCKHLWSIEYAIRMGTLRDIDRFPAEAKVKKVVVPVAETKPLSRSYTEDQYSF